MVRLDTVKVASHAEGAMRQFRAMSARGGPDGDPVDYKDRRTTWLCAKEQEPGGR